MRRLVFRVRAISWIAMVGLIPVVFYYTSRGTSDPRHRNRVDGGWSTAFFMAQPESMLRARLDVEPLDIQGECFSRQH